ncbi:MAG: hypothetical protein FK733_06095 [Asgard group archaeon]|nr:hypothetical protein [Asgard group archaeon]
MNKKIQFFMILSIIGTLCLIQTHPIVAQVNVGMFYSEPADTPVIDGTFESSVWDGNLAKDITLYDVSNQSNFLIIALMAVFNTTSDNLTLGFYIEDSTASFADILGIVFETDPAYELYIDTPNWGFGGGHDIKVHYFDTNNGVDGYTDLGEFDGMEDTYTGGVNHVNSKSTFTGSMYHVEMTAPLDSIEVGSIDYSLAVNDVINFTLIYAEDTSGITYTQYREADNDWDYCELKIGPHPTSSLAFGKPLLLLSIVTIACTIIYIKRKYRK